MADLRKYSGDHDPKSLALHIERQKMERDFAEAKKKGALVAGKADPGIQAMKPHVPARKAIGPHYGRPIGGQEQLRGQTPLLQSRPPIHQKDYGTRVDGSPKGPGFFGEVFTEDPDFYSSELATSISFDGKPFYFPLLVPTLTAEEIAHLVDGGQPTLAIAKKARIHALEREKAGKSPFADFGEQMPLPKSAESELSEGFKGQ